MPGSGEPRAGALQEVDQSGVEPGMPSLAIRASSAMQWQSSLVALLDVHDYLIVFDKQSDRRHRWP
jgi:hypothetical protein